jgi:hypothetical protein
MGTRVDSRKLAIAAAGVSAALAFVTTAIAGWGSELVKPISWPRGSLLHSVRRSSDLEAETGAARDPFRAASAARWPDAGVAAVAEDGRRGSLPVNAWRGHAAAVAASFGTRVVHRVGPDLD